VPTVVTSATFYQVAGDSLTFYWRFSTSSNASLNNGEATIVDHRTDAAVPDVDIVDIVSSQVAGSGGTTGWTFQSYTFQTTGLHELHLRVLHSKRAGPQL
jgi:hypothetical protein